MGLASPTIPFLCNYRKTAYDVLGACVGVSMLLYWSAKILREERVQNRTILFAGGALALSGSFRYSLAPFLVLSVLAVFYFARPKVTWQQMTLFLFVILVGFL